MQEILASKFAERLRKAISERGLAKKKIAEMAGVHPVTISKYLSGKRLPASEELHNLASILRVNTSYLLGTSEEKTPANLQDVLSREDSPLANFRDDPANFEASGRYIGILASLLPHLNTEGLLQVGETLQKEKPSGYEEIMDKLLPLIREKIPEQTIKEEP